MDFKIFNEELQEHFKKMVEGEPILFNTERDRDEIWEVYLDSYNLEDNKIFRERREMDCSCCKSFIRQAGSVIAIKNGEMVSLWDFVPTNDKYKPMVKAMEEYVKSKPIEGVFYFEENKIGTELSREHLKNGDTLVWSHFYIDEIPSIFVKRDCATIQGEKRTNKELLEKFLNIDESYVEDVINLIEDNNLYGAERYGEVLQKLHRIDRKILTSDYKDRGLWELSITVGDMSCRLINTALGEILQNMQKGDSLEVAVKKYEDMTAPSNYKRPKPIFTERQMQEAKKKLEDMGYLSSLRRRYANMGDLNINNSLFVNRDIKVELDEIEDIFKSMKGKSQSNVNNDNFEGMSTIQLDRFINDIMPNANNMEILFDNKYRRNLMSLLTSVEPDAKSMFKWNNNFSWNYNGDLAGATRMKENVKNAGGDVEGYLRFSIQWNDGEVFNDNDFDAHCRIYGKTGENGEIYFGNKKRLIRGGMLDTDIIDPKRGVSAVENITFAERESLCDEEYLFFVNNYSARESAEGFNAEIELNGVIYEYEYNQTLRGGENILVARVILRENGDYKVEHLLPHRASSKEVWGVYTNKFIPIKAITKSPNYWGNDKVGAEHVFFILDGCRNNDKASPFYNEFLNSELDENRKFMEALRGQLKVEDNPNQEQLSGLGFMVSERDEIILKVDGQIIKVMI